MNLFWSLYALFTAHWCLDKVSGSPDLDLCNSTGELPAPELFLDAGSGHMGNSIVLLCMHPSEGTVTRFFFCKDKTLLSVRKAISHLGIYKLSITQDFTGQYSCGYQHRNEMNQETSALSSVRNLMVLSDVHDQANGSASCFDSLDYSAHHPQAGMLRGKTVLINK
ncbi:uncharacterized protein PHA67_018529 isoform 2-T2 [Liasis olivaceus]